MTTTTTSGADDLRTAAQAVVDRWDTPLWKDVPATAEYIGRLRAALAAGQATAAPAQPAAPHGVAYAELPTSNYAGRVYEEGFLIGTCPLYTADQMRAFADATHTLRASHGQAPAGAAEEIDKALNVYAQAFAARVNGWTRQNGDDLPGARSALFAAIHAYAQASTRPTTSPQLVCDYCGALTPDPWHSSGMLHGKMSKHIHSCDACASRGQTPAKPDPAYSEACNLATALFKKHFAHLPDFASGQAVWSLCNSTAGVILQIDNMVSGLVQPPTISPQADSVQEDAARLDFLIDQRAYVVSDPDACPSHWLRWARPDGSTWVQVDEHPTPRAAIDAAMNKGGAA